MSAWRCDTAMQATGRRCVLPSGHAGDHSARCTVQTRNVADYDPCGECPKDECDGCAMCRYFEARA